MVIAAMDRSPSGLHVNPSLCFVRAENQARHAIRVPCAEHSCFCAALCMVAVRHLDSTLLMSAELRDKAGRRYLRFGRSVIIYAHLSGLLKCIPGGQVGARGRGERRGGR